MNPVSGETPVQIQDDLLQFVVEKSCERTVVFDVSMAIVFKNDKARKFLDSHSLPEEIPALAIKIFTAIARGKVAETFPGQIGFRKEIGGRHWFFRVAFREGDQPVVGVFFSDETVSSRFDLDALRQQYHLTRRETAVLRQLLDGKKNLEIGEELDLVEQTVKDYLSSIYSKIGVADRFTLIRHLLIDSNRPDTLPG